MSPMMIRYRKCSGLCVCFNSPYTYSQQFFNRKCFNYISKDKTQLRKVFFDRLETGFNKSVHPQDLLQNHS